MSKQSFLRGAAILGAAGIVVKVLGAIYQIPFMAMIGADGSACYSPAYYIYTILVTVATSGIPVAISRMVSERTIVQNYEGAHRVFRMSLRLMLGIGIVSFLVMFFGADLIATHVSKVPKSALAMQTIAPALLLVPVMASFRGYYQGQQNMKPTALSQVIEQVFRVVFGLLTAYVLYNGIIGLFSSHEPGERGAAGGAFGATAGAVGGLAVMLLVYVLSRRSRRRHIAASKNVEEESNGDILRTMLLISIPITIGACIAPIMSYLDTPIVISRLTATGWARQTAENMYGQISGYVMPLVNLPQAISMALSMSLVPLISSAHRIHDTANMRRNTSLAVRVAVMVGMPCAAGMAVLACPILLLLYSSHASEAIHVAPTFALYAASILFIAVVQTVSGILQGINKQMIPVRNMLIGIVIKIVTTAILVGIPSLNIKGAGIGTLITYIVVAGMDVYAACKYTGTRLNPVLAFARPAAATGVMAGVAALCYYVIFHQAPTAIGTTPKIACLAAILIAGIVYIIMLFVTRSIKPEELKRLRGGERLLRVLTRMRIVKDED
ncbi:MAG: putative polysaccharide biosynthesis protein [Anaerovoracaceae bacterium]|jgi:stage V sporulation protein B